MRAEPDAVKLKFPLWQYLTQPVFSPDFKSLNPVRFWRLHNRERLEKAWNRSGTPASDFRDGCTWLPEDDGWQHGAHPSNTNESSLIQFLESCWVRELDSWERPQNWSKECDGSEEFY